MSNMAEETTALTEHPAEFVEKPTGVFHARADLNFPPLTNPQRRVNNTCIWFSGHDGFTTKEYSMPVNEFKALIGAEKTENHAWLQRQGQELVTKPIFWNVMGKDKADKEWGVFSYFSYFGVSRGRVRWILNPKLVEKLQNPAIYSKMRLLIQRELTGQYAFPLYEFLAEYLNSRPTSGQVKLPPVTVEELREDILEVRGKSYQVFKKFKAKILEPAIQDVNTTDIKIVKTEYKREGRPIAKIIFTIESNDSYQLPLPLEEIAPETARLIKRKAEDDDLVGLLIEQGVHERKSNELCGKYPRDHIQANLNYTLKKIDDGSVKRRAPYLVKSIEDNYAEWQPVDPKKAAEDKKRAADAKKKEDEARRKEAEGKYQSDLQQAHQRYRQGRLEKYLDGLPADDKRRVDAYCRTTLDSVVLKLYEKDGWSAGFVLMALMDKYSHEIVDDPKFQSIDAFEEDWNKRKKAA